MEADATSVTCRGCLTVETSAVLHPFTNKTVRELFTSCTSVKISLKEAHLPMQICSLCFGRCENWASFRSRCQDNDEELRAASVSKMGNEEQIDVDVGQFTNTPDEQWYEESQAADDISIIDMECNLKAPVKQEDRKEQEQEQEQEQEYMSGQEDTAASQDHADDGEEYNDEEPGPSKASYEQAIFFCDECGKQIKGGLNFRKHTFQHEKNLTKRVRNIQKALTEDNRHNVTLVKKEELVLVKSWTQKARKKLKDSGEEYINSRAELVGKRRVRPVPCTCNHKCNDLFSSTDRERIFRKYWEMDYGGQRQFVFDNVLEKKVQRRITIYDSRRQFTLEYSFEGKRVCKRFFIGTLDITDRIVMNCRAKARQNLDITKDLRGKGNSKK